MTTVPPSHCPIRMMRNSAGLTAAIPISTVQKPFSRNSLGLVSSSHLTKNACSGLFPNRAPSRQSVVRIGFEIAADRGPKHAVIGLEHDPAGAPLNRILDVAEKAADVHISPGFCFREGTAAPHQNALARKRSDTVHTQGVEDPLGIARDSLACADGTADILVGRSLVNPAVQVDPRQIPATCPLGGTETPSELLPPSTLIQG